MTGLRVAVLSGGRSSEHEVSLASGAAVRAGLGRAGHEVLDVRLARDGGWLHEGEELALAPGRGLLGADAAFPVLHGPFGEDGTVQGLLECLDVAYVGAGVLASALSMHKVAFKDAMAAAGLPQIRYRGVREASWRADRDAALAGLEALGLPAFVKPAQMGSSVGIVKAGSRDELGAALEQAFSYDGEAIVESLADGIEVECSVLGNERPLASQPGEIDVHGEWYDYEAKYEPGGMDLVIPARLAEPLRERVRALAVEAFERAGCAGLARVDFFVCGGEVILNELNTMPGFTPTSVFARLFEASGIAYEELLDRLVALGIERFEADRAHRH